MPCPSRSPEGPKPKLKGPPIQGDITLIKESGIYILEVMDTGPLVRCILLILHYCLSWSGPTRTDRGMARLYGNRYGTDWAYFNRAAHQSINYTKVPHGWSALVEARPCDPKRRH